MQRNLPKQLFESRFWRKNHAQNEKEGLGSTDTVSGKAEKIAKDIQKNWLRYLVEIVILSALVWTVLEKIHSIGFGYVKDERDVLARENEIFKKQLIAAEPKVPTQPQKESTPSSKPPKGGTRPALPLTKQSVAEKKTLGVGEEARPIAAIPKNDSRNNESSNLDINAKSSEAPQKLNGIGCESASESLRALEAIVGAPNASRPSLSKQMAAKPYVAELAEIFGKNKPLTEIANELPLSLDNGVLTRALLTTRRLIRARCEASASSGTDILSSAAPSEKRCSAARRILDSLQSLKGKTEAETILTSKGHLVEIYNKLLFEAQSEFRDDSLVVNLKGADTYYWHAETQKYLLNDIGVLGERLNSISSACSLGKQHVIEGAR